MTLEIVVLLIILALVIALFFSGALPIDVTALVCLLLITFGGYLTPHEALTGFSSPVVVTLFGVFFVAAAIRETGIADRLAFALERLLGKNESGIIAAVMLVTAFFSAFMNNVAAGALVLPAAIQIGVRSGVSASRLMLPLAFGAILGGTTTLIGTPPNIISAHLLSEAGLVPLAFLEFTPLGLLLVVLGTYVTAFWGTKFLPPAVRTGGIPNPGALDLVSTYHLDDGLFWLHLPLGSTLAGKTLLESGIGELLGLQVLEIRRGSETNFSPQAGEILQATDKLLVTGNFEEVKLLIGAELSSGAAEFDGVNFVALDYGMVQASKKLRLLLERSKEAILGFWDGAWHSSIAAEANFENGILILSGEVSKPLLEAKVPLPEALYKELVKRLLKLSNREGPNREGLLPVKLSKVAGLALLGSVPNGEGYESRLLFDSKGIFERVKVLSQQRIERQVKNHLSAPLVEVVLSPRSRLIGTTLTEAKFRERYELQVIRILRAGAIIESHLGNLKLQFGDALLLLGKVQRSQLLKSDPDFLVVSGGAMQSAALPEKAWAAILALCLLVALPWSGIAPSELAALSAAMVVVLSGALTMQQAYREVEWRIIIFMAAILPLAVAFEKTGCAKLIATFLAPWLHDQPIAVAVLVIAILSSAVSQLLDGSLAVLLIGPVAISLSGAVPVAPQGLMLATAIGASMAFVTPFSHKVNLLVMGPGGYQAKDFALPGLLLSAIFLATLVVYVILVYGYV